MYCWIPWLIITVDGQIVRCYRRIHCSALNTKKIDAFFTGKIVMVMFWYRCTNPPPSLTQRPFPDALITEPIATAYFLAVKTVEKKTNTDANQIRYWLSSKRDSLYPLIQNPHPHPLSPPLQLFTTYRATTETTRPKIRFSAQFSVKGKI